MSIKSFFYLDEYKLQSMSSQMFEGLIDYKIHYNQRHKEEGESQKGPVASGRILSDLSMTQVGSIERKVLHDHAYEMFEQELIKKNLLLQANFPMDETSIANLKAADFVKLTGHFIMIDHKYMIETVETMPSFIEAAGFLAAYPLHQSLKQILNEQMARAATPKQRQEIAKKMKEIGKSVLSKDVLEKDYVEKLVLALKFCYRENLEVTVPLENDLENTTFACATLNRDYLREEEDIFIRKFSRFTERKFTLVGLVSQSQPRPLALPLIKQNETSPDTKSGDAAPTGESPVPVPAGQMKGVIQNAVYAITGMEEAIFGRSTKEIIVDPLAIYREFAN